MGGVEGDGYDFWNNDVPAYDQFGKYTVDAYESRFEEIVANHDKSKPLFVYYAEQQVHIPLELPPDPKHVEKCIANNVKGGNSIINRTVLCAMASRLDESVGNMLTSLENHALWENTIFWGFSDNGGMAMFQDDGFPASASSNWPLRGCKTSLFEGGVRSVSFVAGGFIPTTARGQTRSQLLHVADILPTLASAAQVPVQNSLSSCSSCSSSSSSSDQPLFLSPPPSSPPPSPTTPHFHCPLPLPRSLPPVRPSTVKTHGT
jgi:arylsulfatase A-like enzyme